MADRKILVTGMSGLIGGALRRYLGDRYELRALNRRPLAGVPGHWADIADLEAIRPAFAGIDVVVHLAAIAGSSPPWEAVLPANVIGTYNVFEAAREASVERVIFASSGATVSACERDSPFAELAAGRYGEVGALPRLTHESPVRPSGLYGCSKVWGEALARHYSDAHGLSAICLRIGAVNAADRPRAPREFSVWCSQARHREHDRALHRGAAERALRRLLRRLRQSVELPRHRARARRGRLHAARPRRGLPVRLAASPCAARAVRR